MMSASAPPTPPTHTHTLSSGECAPPVHPLFGGAAVTAHLWPVRCSVAIANDDKFAAFEDAVCEFQRVDLAAMTPDVRLAFVINLYNLVILHAFAKVGIPKSDLKRYRFYDQMGCKPLAPPPPHPLFSVLKPLWS